MNFSNDGCKHDWDETDDSKIDYVDDEAPTFVKWKCLKCGRDEWQKRLIIMGDE